MFPEQIPSSHQPVPTSVGLKVEILRYSKHLFRAKPKKMSHMGWSEMGHTSSPWFTTENFLQSNSLKLAWIGGKYLIFKQTQTISYSWKNKELRILELVSNGAKSNMYEHRKRLSANGVVQEESK